MHVLGVYNIILRAASALRAPVTVLVQRQPEEVTLGDVVMCVNEHSMCTIKSKMHAEEAQLSPAGSNLMNLLTQSHTVM